MTSRREILKALGIATLGHPLVGLAQQSQKMRRIGFLGNGVFTSAGATLVRQTLKDALRRLGYEEGRNLVIEWRYAEFKPERLPVLADELVRLDLELIVTLNAPGTLAAMQATKTIPIVMVSYLPIRQGLIESHARPGGNVTGFDTMPAAETSLKIYQLLKEAVPGAKRATRLSYPRAPFDPAGFTDRWHEVASKTGLTIAHVDVTRNEELAGALDRIAASRPDVFFVSGDPFIVPHFPAIAAFAVKRKLPSMSEHSNYTASGGLLHYGADPMEPWVRIASYIDRILRGAKPGDLPVEQPTKYELVLNRKTAKEIGLTLPLPFMRQVTRVIE